MANSHPWTTGQMGLCTLFCITQSYTSDASPMTIVCQSDFGDSKCDGNDEFDAICVSDGSCSCDCIFKSDGADDNDKKGSNLIFAPGDCFGNDGNDNH